jgi:hypothetical protein
MTLFHFSDDILVIHLLDQTILRIITALSLM